MMFTFWALGGLASFLVALLLLPLGAISWRILLASGTIPAVVVFLLRRNVPENSRWLVNQGRSQEAREAVSALGVGVGDVVAARSQEGAGRRSPYVQLSTSCWRIALFEGVFMFVFAATGLLLDLPATDFC